MSVLARAGTVCRVRVQRAWLCQGGGGAYGWGKILRRRGSFSFCLEGHVSRRTLFGLAAPLFTRRGAVPHLSLDPIVLHHLRLGTGGHLSRCCPKPVLRQGKGSLRVSQGSMYAACKDRTLQMQGNLDGLSVQI